MAAWASDVNIPNLGDDLSLGSNPVQFSVHTVTSGATPDMQETTSAAGRLSAPSMTVQYANEPDGRMPVAPSSIPGPWMGDGNSLSTVRCSYHTEPFTSGQGVDRRWQRVGPAVHPTKANLDLLENKVEKRIKDREAALAGKINKLGDHVNLTSDYILKILGNKFESLGVKVK